VIDMISVAHRFRLVAAFCFTGAFFVTASSQIAPSLEQGFRFPPFSAKPHTYWLWLNGHVHLPTAIDELKAMKEAGLGGVLLFEMGARGDQSLMPPAGPSFLSTNWVRQLRTVTEQAKALGLQFDMSVISSWDLGGPWVEPRNSSMALYSTEIVLDGGNAANVSLPFPLAEASAPKGVDGKPAYWTDVAVLAVREPRRLPGHTFVLRLDPPGVHILREVTLDNGTPAAPADLAATMTPVRNFSLAVSCNGTSDVDFTEVLHGSLPPTAGPVRFPLPTDTQARYVRLTLLSGHDATRPRWTLAEFEAFDDTGMNVAGSRMIHPSRDGACTLRAPESLTISEWSAKKLNDGSRTGANGVFSSAGLPPFNLPAADEIVDITSHVDSDGRLRWVAPPGRWTILRYVCMITGERLKLPTPASDGLATDHLNPAATRQHMDHVITQLRAGLGDLRQSGLTNLYLASYEVVGRVWSPVFAGEFKKRRGYDLTCFLPAIFGARVGDEETTKRFLFDYKKTLGEVLVDAYYRTAREIANAAGLTIKSEAGGPGPPIHTPPVDALLANGAVDEIQGEFWPFWENMDSIWVVKETASAGHIYGKPVIHMEAFTSFNHWSEGPQDLKPSADRAFCEGANHMVWHTWTHQPPEAGLPGWAYVAGTHLNRSVTWWPKAKPFLDYLARSSFLLQRGQFVADVLYYYGDGGDNFVGPRRNPSTLGPGYDYDVTNADVILHRLSVRDGRIALPEGISYAVLVLPDRDDINPAVLAKIESLVAAGATVVGRKPKRASGLEGFPASDNHVREIAQRLWADLDEKSHTYRAYGDGRIYSGVPERQVLTELGIAPDFTASAALDFTHHHDGEGEIYFVRNKTSAAITETVGFRVGSRIPEFWDPVSGKISNAPEFHCTDGAVNVPLSLAPNGSVFVIFREHTNTTSRSDTGKKSTDLPEPISLDSDWTIDFQSPLGEPAQVVQPRVGPWTKSADTALLSFSGTGTYRKSFILPADWRSPGTRIDLDLGNLWAIGEITLNGKPLGIVWTSPFRVDCTDAVRVGENQLIVEVVNTWHNRLIGDAHIPANERKTRTNITASHGIPWKAWADLNPIASGLFGPVRLVPVTVRNTSK
jgi:hypothetical protein